MASKHNFVAKHMNTFNKSVTMRDRKNDYVRQKSSKKDYLDEWEEEMLLEALTEDLEIES